MRSVHWWTAQRPTIWSLFLASGYLKVDSYKIGEDGEEHYTLSLTNKEVRIMFKLRYDAGAPPDRGSRDRHGSHQPPVQLGIWRRPYKGQHMYARRAGVANTITCYRSKAAPSSSFDPSYCSWIYFFIASSVILPIVAT